MNTFIYSNIFFSEADSPSATGGGCFSADSTVMTSDGRRLRMREVKPGQKLLSVDPKTGSVHFSQVLTFLDRDEDESRRFVTLKTEDGKKITVTPTHLVYAKRVSIPEYEEDIFTNEITSSYDDFEAFYAGDLSPGDELLTKTSDGELVSSTISSVSSETISGVYAPLTESGNLVVDDIVASCYAVVDSQSIAHASFWPLRTYKKLFGVDAESVSDDFRGVHWYADWLYSIARNIMPSHLR